MKQGDTIEIVIESIGGGGEGLARCGGHTVVVPFALTGEKAAAKVVYVKRDGTVFARLKNIEKPFQISERNIRIGRVLVSPNFLSICFYLFVGKLKRITYIMEQSDHTPKL